MNVTSTAAFAMCVSLTMLLLVAEANAQSGSRNAPSFGSSSRILNTPPQSSANYAPPQRLAPPSQPITNVYRPAAPMPQSNYNGYPSTNGYVSQPGSYVSHSGCNSTIALRVPRSNFTPAPAYRTQSSPVNYLPSPQYRPMSQYVAPANNGFSPSMIRPGCANGNCGQ